MLEAHRLNSAYIKNSDFFPMFLREIAYDENKRTDYHKVYFAACKFDPGVLLHGMFLTLSGTSGLRIPRALSGFIEARNVHEAASGGVKNDSVRASKGREDESESRTAAEGYGNVPYHRVEYTAEHIDAFFNLDLVQLRSYGLSPATTKLLYALAVYKIQAFLDRGLRLRTACDFQVGELEVTKPKPYALPSEAEAAAALAELIPVVAKEGVFASPAVSVAKYAPKTKEPKDKDKGDEKPGSKKKAGKKAP